MTAQAEQADRGHGATALLVDAPIGHPSGMRQWWALTTRIVRVMGRMELAVAFVTPLIFTVGFYFPLRHIMQHGGALGGMSYAQYVTPVIALQTMSFTMMSNAQMAAFEGATGLSTRLRTMPVARFAPMAARISAGMVRSVVSVAATILFSYLIGFRFLGGMGQAALFCVFCLGVGTVLSLGADALGTLIPNPPALSQALNLPTIVLGMLSSGFSPESNFPGWSRQFVRDQPISQFAYAMRDMATAGGTSWQVLMAPTLWLVGLAAVFIPAAVWASWRQS